MRIKFLMCMVSLVILCFIGTAQAQDPCDSYHDEYRICVEKQNEGREMDYHSVCKFIDNQFKTNDIIILRFTVLIQKKKS